MDLSTDAAAEDDDEDFSYQDLSHQPLLSASLKLKTSNMALKNNSPRYTLPAIHVRFPTLGPISHVSGSKIAF